MPRKRKLMKPKVPQFYKYTHCRVEGHHWALQEGFPKRSVEGGVIFRSECPGCGSVRVRYFNYRGVRIASRCYTIYPKDYQIKGGMARPHFVIQMAVEAKVE